MVAQGPVPVRERTSGRGIQFRLRPGHSGKAQLSRLSTTSRGAVARAARGQELRDGIQVVAHGDQRRLNRAVLARPARGRCWPAAHCTGTCGPPCPRSCRPWPRSWRPARRSSDSRSCLRPWRRAPADSPGRRRASAPDRLSKCGRRALKLRHLEGKSGGRGQRIGEDLARARDGLRQKPFFRSGRMPDSRLKAKAVPTCTPAAPCSSASRSFCGVSVSARQPERNAQRAQFGDVDLVALAVDRLAGGVELQLAARRRIVAARRRAFDHQAVDASAGPAQHGGGQGVGGDDGQKPGPVEHRQGAFGIIRPDRGASSCPAPAARRSPPACTQPDAARQRRRARRECAAECPRPSARSPRRPAWRRRSRPGAASAPSQEN